MKLMSIIYLNEINVNNIYLNEITANNIFKWN